MQGREVLNAADLPGFGEPGQVFTLNGETVKSWPHPRQGKRGVEENALLWRDTNGRIIAGQPNPGGRGHVPVKRDELAGKFIDDLIADWEKHGKQALEDCRETHPHMYLKTVASLVPRAAKVEHTVGNTFIELLQEMSRNRAAEHSKVINGTVNDGEHSDVHSLPEPR